MINILIRTNGRRNYFNRCLESIVNQTYFVSHEKEVNVIIGCDGNADYIDSIEWLTVVHVRRIERISGKRLNGALHFPFNLYFNEMYKYCKEGYIMFLDDDDMFADRNSLQTIVNNLRQNAVTYWRVKIGSRTIPNDYNFGKHPVCKDMSGIGFAFHTDFIPFAQWTEYKQADYRIAAMLYDIMPEKKWVRNILTKSQTVNHSGMVVDYKDSDVSLHFLTCVYKRPEVFRQMAASWARMSNNSKYRCAMTVVLSYGDKYLDENRETANKYGFEIVYYKNKPVGEKHSAGVNYVYSNHDFTYFVNLGSDNIILPDIWKVYDGMIKSGVKYFGCNRFYAYNKKLGAMKIVHVGSLVSGAMRMIHKSILRSVIGVYGLDLYNNKYDSGLDTSSDDIIKRYSNEHPVIISEPYVIDLKTDTNINHWTQTGGIELCVEDMEAVLSRANGLV